MPLNTAPRYSYDPAAYAKAQTASHAAQAAYDAQAGEVSKAAAWDRKMHPMGYSMGQNSQGSAATLAARARLQELQQGMQSANQATAGAKLDEQKQADQQIMDATYGRGDAVESDPTVAAALAALNPAQAQANSYAQSTDANAAQAGAMADMQRQQFAAAGIGLNDPAAQARLRQTETARMQGNNAALATSQQVGQDAAGQAASMRLAQMGQATQSYNLGAQMQAQKQYGPEVPTGRTAQVPTGRTAQGTAGTVNSQTAPWQPTPSATASGSPAVAAQGNTRVQTPSMSVADRNDAQAAWAASQPKAVGAYNPGSIQVNGQGAAADAARRRLQQQQTQTGDWDQSFGSYNG